MGLIIQYELQQLRKKHATCLPHHSWKHKAVTNNIKNGSVQGALMHNTIINLHFLHPCISHGGNRQLALISPISCLILIVSFVHS